MYTIKEAALRAGVSIPLLRAWERRYRIVEPERTASGYRLYDDSSIERIRAMRRLVESGWSASQAARQVAAAGVTANTGREPIRLGGSRAPSSVGGEDDLTIEFVDAAAALDEGRVDAALDDVFASGSFERVVDDRLMPALRALGDRWSRGALSVGAEHAASHAVLRRLSASFEAAGGSPSEHPVLVGLPPGSRHEIGALAFATAVRRRGIGVVYLGADVPADSWVDAVRATRARAVVIGIPMAADRESANDVAARLSASVDGVIVAVGGPGSVEAPLPASVVLLPDGMSVSADVLEDALARDGAVDGGSSRRR